MAKNHPKESSKQKTPVQEAAAPSTKTPVHTVQMLDGRSVDFAGKRKMLKVIDGDKIRFDFVNGETKVFHLPHDHAHLHRLALHGASQKIGDETSGEEKVEDMVNAVEAMIGRLNSSEDPFARVKGAGDSFSGSSIVIKAIALVRGVSVEKVKEFLEATLKANPGYTRQALYRSFRNPNSEVGKKILELEAESGANFKGPNAEELLAGLGG